MDARPTAVSIAAWRAEPQRGDVRHRDVRDDGALGIPVGFVGKGYLIIIEVGHLVTPLSALV
jgi:hypothetical protein